MLHKKPLPSLVLVSLDSSCEKVLVQISKFSVLSGYGELTLLSVTPFSFSFYFSRTGRTKTKDSRTSWGKEFRVLSFHKHKQGCVYKIPSIRLPLLAHELLMLMWFLFQFHITHDVTRRMVYLAVSRVANIQPSLCDFEDTHTLQVCLLPRRRYRRLWR